MTPRETTRQRTRQALLEASSILFTTRGFEHVIMDEIAHLAGVSRPTAFRYFRTKADLVFAPQDEWRQLVTAHPTDLTLDPATRIEQAARRITQAIDADPDRVLTSYRIAMTSPTLQQVAAARDREWISVFASLLTPPLSSLDATMVGGAFMGVLSTAFDAWGSDPTSSTLTSIVERGLPFVTAGLRQHKF